MALRLKSFAAPLLAACLVASPALAEPALWQVSDADSSIYLFGSFHLFTHDVDWRSARFDQLLAEADSVVFEMLLNADSTAQMVYLTLTEGMYHGEHSIADVLTPTELAQLTEAAALMGLHFDEIRRLRPWLLAGRLSEGGLGAVTPGVESALQAEIDPARQDALETAADQFGFLSSLSEAEQVDMLMAAVDAVLSGDFDIEAESATMLNDWAEGDLAGLEATFNESLTPTDVAFYDILINERNRRWITPLEQMLADNATNLVVVGAGHLVGDAGVPALLVDAGYTVTRIDAGAPPAGDAP